MRNEDGTYRRRRRRYDVPGHAHYLTFSCWHNQPFLSRQRSCQWLAEAIEAARLRHPFELWAYVIMPEHVHMLILPRNGVAVRRVLSAVKQSVAKRAVAWVRRNSPAFLEAMRDRQPSGRCCYRFWQPGGGYDRNIWTAEELHEKIGYIHANPVRRGLVQAPEDWAWSSVHAWETGRDEPIRIDRESLPPIER